MTAEGRPKRNTDCRGDGQGEQQEGLTPPNPPQKEPMPQENAQNESSPGLRTLSLVYGTIKAPRLKLTNI